MIKRTVFVAVALFCCASAWADGAQTKNGAKTANDVAASQAVGARTTISLDGTWDFDQTTDAFPPKKFTRTIPVPGLVHLAVPRIEDYDKFFKKPLPLDHQQRETFPARDYTPRYSWYRRTVDVPAGLDGKQAYITVRKSQYVTQIYVNGIDVGSSMECCTPIEFPITHALRFGGKNEILIKVGDRYWLPRQAPGQVDKEKMHYLPGIWDDVEISFTGPVRAHKVFMLPSVKESKVTAKILLYSLHPALNALEPKMWVDCRANVSVRERSTGRQVAQGSYSGRIRRDNQTPFDVQIPMKDVHTWSPDDPFLYTATIDLYDGDALSDTREVTFGMRDFGREGKHFTLNGEKIFLRGTNITLQRFFEDPECGDLVWNREWVTRLIADLPKSVNWNAMRICVGIVPDFWYDIADQAGVMLQNEWFNWHTHGWDDQTRAEFYNWIWSDGNHPSIVIWDAMNENWNEYIGNSLIPELKKLDPTRIWDAGYMTSDDMPGDDMDEPHPYRVMAPNPRKPYNLGNFNDWGPFTSILDKSSPQLVNEYGWMWLWRDGSPSILTVKNYDYYLGPDATPAERRQLQAYWMQLETEWLRAERSLAGVLYFCHLTNNYGFTGDSFIGEIKDLNPSPMFYWFKHCFNPQAVFINLTDERYMKHLPPRAPGSALVFNMVGINDNKADVTGRTTVKLYDSTGKIVHRGEVPTTIPGFYRCEMPYLVTLPDAPGGYLLAAEFLADGAKEPVISRRYIKVGDAQTKFTYYEIQP